MDDLIAWLRAQLDDDERVARDATQGEWRWAEVDAKRRILDEYEQAKTYYDQHREAPAGEAYGLLTAIKLLALPFAGREGYRDEWRP